MISLKRLDFTLLSLLVQIHDTGSVSQAGAALGLSQPASSNALARLRAELGDELFLRSKAGMVPTAYAEKITPEIRAHLAAIEQTLGSPREFNPATSTETFRVSLSGLGETVFIPPITAQLAQSAPGIRIVNTATRQEELAAALAQRNIDIAIGALDIEGHGVCHQHLFDDDFVLVGGRQLLAQANEGLDRTGTRIALVSPTTTYGANLEEIMVRAGLAEHACIRLQHFGALPDLLNSQNIASILPRQYADKLVGMGLANILDIELPDTRFEIDLVWHRKTSNDPGCAWLRAMVAELFGRKG